MHMYNGQQWHDLSRPLLREKSLLPVMAEFESRLPLRLAPGFWLHRNISWSDVEAVDGSGAPPPDPCWPLMYVIGKYRRAVLGVELHIRPAEDSDKFKLGVIFSAPRGLRCLAYYIDPANPGAVDAVVDNVAAQVANLRRAGRPAWMCATTPAHPEKTGSTLLARRLVEEAENGFLPTLRGEEAGLTAMFTNDGGKVRRDVRWSAATKRVLDCPPEIGPISLKKRGERLEKGLASSGQAAKAAVLRLADMPLEKYLLSGPGITLNDLKKVRAILRLRDGCTFQDAAAALYRRWEGLSASGRALLMPVLTLFALPGCQVEDNLRERVLANFRKGVYPSW